MGFCLEIALGCCAGGLALWALAIAAFTYIESQQRSGQRADDGRRDTWN
jgi:hypothetical protein